MNAIVALRLISNNGEKGIQKLYDEGISYNSNIFAHKPWFQQLFKQFYITDKNVAQNIINTVAGKQNINIDSEQSTANKQAPDVVKLISQKIDNYIKKYRELEKEKEKLQQQKLANESLADVKNAIMNKLNIQKLTTSKIIKNHNLQVIQKILYLSGNYFLDEYQKVLSQYGINPDQVTKYYKIANDPTKRPNQRQYTKESLFKIKELLKNRFPTT